MSNAEYNEAQFEIELAEAKKEARNAALEEAAVAIFDRCQNSDSEDLSYNADTLAAFIRAMKVPAILLPLLFVFGVAAGESDRTLWKKMLAAGEKERVLTLEKFTSFLAGKHEDTESKSRRRAEELTAAKGRYFPTLTLAPSATGVIRKRVSVHTIIDEQTALYQIDGKDFVWIEKHPTESYKAGRDIKIDVPLICTTVTKAEVRKSIETVYVLVPLKKP